MLIHRTRRIGRFFSIALIVVLGPWAGTASLAQLTSIEEVVSPFEIDTDVEAGGGSALVFDAQASYSQFADRYAGAKPFRLSAFSLSSDLQVNFNLRPIHVMPQGGQALVVGAAGTRRITPRVATFAGYAPQHGGSYAFLAISPSMVNGYFVVSNKTYIMTSGDPKTSQAGKAVISDASLAFAEAPDRPWTCQVFGNLAEPLLGGMREAAGVFGGGGEVRIADMFMEGDHQFRTLFNSSEDAADYILALVAAVSEIYRRDLGAEMRIPDGYLRIWEVIPPWGVINDFGGMSAFKGYWSGASNPLRDIDRAAVHLFTRPVFGGVAAAIGGLCSHFNGYEISSLNGFFPYPLQHTSPSNWDVVVVAHEFGHTFGSLHTFSYNPPIDCNDGSGPDNGTIMSYCHLEPGGINNVGLRFHANVQNVMRNYIDGLNCLEVLDFDPGDYNHDGVVDEIDLDALLMCINLEFEAAGCVDTFDVDLDGEVTLDDYNLLLDCNGNGEPDFEDIASGFSDDCNANFTPDECEFGGLTNCDGINFSDLCDIASGISSDLNQDGIPDECQAALSFQVDDDGPADFGPGDPLTSDPLEDGSPAHPFDTIQKAIDAVLELEIANPDQTFVVEIVVADGIYSGLGNRDIDLRGRPYILRSANGPASCIIDCEGTPSEPHRGFVFEGAGGAGASIDGFTIINGYSNAGGAIYSILYSPTFTNCVFRDNTATGSGGAIHAVFGDVTIHNCLFDHNLAPTRGGAVYTVFNGTPLISNCTLINNLSSNGGGVNVGADSELIIRDSILWGNFSNTGDAIYLNADAEATVSFSDVEGGIGGVVSVDPNGLTWAAGNLSSDPEFASGPAGDYYLSQTQAGQALNSACINSGSGLATNLGLETLTTRTDEIGDVGVVDIGFHYPILNCTPGIFGDLDDSGDVDVDDLMCMLEGLSGIVACPGVTYAELDIGTCDSPDGDLNLYDLVALLEALGGNPLCETTCP